MTTLIGANTPPVYTLSYIAGAHGTLLGSSTQVVNGGANGAAVTAVPDLGYYFVNWSDASTSNPRIDAAVSTSSTLTAGFTLIAPPTLVAATISSITQTSATLSAQITNSGGSLSTIEGFNYGSALSYGTIASSTGGFGVGTFNQPITGLACNTTYHVQAFAVNTVGTGTSTDTIFSTAGCPVISSGGSSVSPAQLARILAPSVAATAYLNTVKIKSTPVAFIRTLALNSEGADVKALQKYLNAKGYVIAVKGPGSNGNETARFGILTQKALARFQKANNISPAIGFFGPITRAFINNHQ